VFSLPELLSPSNDASTATARADAAAFAATAGLGRRLRPPEITRTVIVADPSDVDLVLSSQRLRQVGVIAAQRIDVDGGPGVEFGYVPIEQLSGIAGAALPSPLAQWITGHDVAPWHT